MVKQFDLTQTFNLKGDWFLPEDANQRLSGELSYSPEDGERGDGYLFHE